jgi:hypothetical protein
MRKPPQLDALEQRIAALTARRDAVRARERQRERAEDLRRKILVGALVLAQWPNGEPPAEWRRALDQRLTRAHDRRLFRLDVMSVSMPAKGPLPAPHSSTPLADDPRSESSQASAESA